MWWIFVLGIAFCVYRALSVKKATGGIPFLYTECQEACSISLISRALSFIFFWASFLFLIFSFVNGVIGGGPLEHFFQKTMHVYLPPHSSKVVSFVVDQSGSMGEPMPGDENHSKMFIVQKALQKCIAELDAESYGSDLISLMAFARAANVLVPFTRDRTRLDEKIASLVPETVPLLNGTAIGYAIFKNVRLTLACKAFASETSQKEVFPRRSMILVTDGLEEPNPADRTHPFRSMSVQQALENAAASHIAVYYVNVDKNTYRMMTEEEREKLASAVARTGGKYFEVTPGASLDSILYDIAEKEKISVPFSNEYQLSLGLWLVTLALLFFALSRLLETALVRVTR